MPLQEFSEDYRDMAMLRVNSWLCAQVRMGCAHTQNLHSKGTRTMQAVSDSDSYSESRRRSPRRLPAGWDRRVEADYRH